MDWSPITEPELGTNESAKPTTIEKVISALHDPAWYYHIDTCTPTPHPPDPNSEHIHNDAPQRTTAI